MQFLVHGSIAYDLLFQYEGSFTDAIDPKALEKLSVSYFAPHFERHHGGTSANIAWNLALLGARPLMVGAVGDDGSPYVELLKERGIDTRFVSQDKKYATAVAVIATDGKEHQIAFFHPGADAHAILPDIADLREEISYAVISPRNQTLMIGAADQCIKLKIPYLFDPGQQTHQFSADEFKRAVKGSAGLVVNEYEWELAKKKLGMTEKVVAALCGLLVITLGDKGLILISKDQEAKIKACKPEKVLNPTGAGDAVRAGLLYGLAKKWSLEKVGQLCAALGSFVVEQEGAMMERLTWEDIQSRVVENYGEELPM